MPLQENIFPPRFVGSPKPSRVGDGVEYDNQTFTLHFSYRIPSPFTLEYLISAKVL